MRTSTTLAQYIPQQDTNECYYEIESENLYHDNLGIYRSYGIRVTSDDYTYLLRDVSVCEKTVVHMVELFNNHRLLPDHLHDVIVDMLG